MAPGNRVDAGPSDRPSSCCQAPSWAGAGLRRSVSFAPIFGAPCQIFHWQPRFACGPQSTRADLQAAPMPGRSLRATRGADGAGDADDASSRHGPAAIVGLEGGPRQERVWEHPAARGPEYGRPYLKSAVGLGAAERAACLLVLQVPCPPCLGLDWFGWRASRLEWRGRENLANSEIL